MKHSLYALFAVVLVSANAHAVFHGTQIPESKYPAVKKLNLKGQGTCTGTMITPKLMLTAGHCLEFAIETGFWGGKSLNLTVDGVKADEKAYRIHRKFTARGPGHMAYDIALVKFPRAFPNTARIASRSLTEGDPVTIVGYGVTRSGANDSGIKREGHNRAGSVDMGQILVSAQEDDLQAANGKYGDSGGPLFNALNEVAGTAGRQLVDNGAMRGTHLSSYINVTDPEIEEFITKAKQELGQ